MKIKILTADSELESPPLPPSNPNDESDDESFHSTLLDSDDDDDEPEVRRSPYMTRSSIGKKRRRIELEQVIEDDDEQSEDKSETLGDSDTDSNSDSDSDPKSQFNFFTKGISKLLLVLDEEAQAQSEPLAKRRKTDLKNYSEEQISKILETEKELMEYKSISKNIKNDILLLPISINSKINIIEKYDILKSMRPGSDEYSKYNRYLSNIQKVPFGKYNKLPVVDTKNQMEVSEYLSNAKDIFDKCIFGQNEAKNKFLQIIAKWISNPEATGEIIGLHGPPGVGKTTILKHGLSKAINRPLQFFSLGGATDGSILEGHSFTYVGATNGRLVDMLISSKCMNPIIFFDELDKISSSGKGEEIENILVHLTDPTQNQTVHDRYYSGVDFDFSKALIVFSYNDPNKISPILRDRITEIKMNGFSIEDKISIAQNYIMPEIYQELGIDNSIIDIKPEALAQIGKYIIYKYTDEYGVRGLKQCIKMILMKLNLIRYVPEMQWSNFSLPITYTTLDDKTREHLDYLLKEYKDKPSTNRSIMNELMMKANAMPLMSKDGYKLKDKITIANDFLIPELYKIYSLSTDFLRITPEGMTYIINTYTHEKGIEELRECLNTICQKISLMRYVESARWENFSLPVCIMDDKESQTRLRTILHEHYENNSAKRQATFSMYS
jgi:ATP-dependent Lon protease